MQKEEIVGLAVRLFAIFLGFHTVRYVLSLIPYLSSSSANHIGVAFLISLVVISSLVITLLWLFPLTIAAKLIPSFEPKDRPEPLCVEGVQVVAFSVMGLWVLTTAIPDAFYWIVLAYRVKHADLESASLSTEQVAYIFSTAVELIIGLWLLFGSQGLVGVIRRIRYAGT